MTGRFIILTNPAICCSCTKLIRKGRAAFWDAGTFACYSCVKKKRGEAPESAEEKLLVDDMIDQRN